MRRDEIREEEKKDEVREDEMREDEIEMESQYNLKSLIDNLCTRNVRENACTHQCQTV